MSDALLVAEDVSAGYHGHPIVHDLNLTRAGREGRRPARPERRRQDHDAADALRGPAAAEGRDLHRRQADEVALTLSGDLPALKGEIFVDGKATKSPLYARAKKGSRSSPRSGRCSCASPSRRTCASAAATPSGARALPRAAAAAAAARGAPLGRRAADALARTRARSRTPKILLVDELSLGLAPLVVIRLLDAVRARRTITASACCSSSST